MQNNAPAQSANIRRALAQAVSPDTAAIRALTAYERTLLISLIGLVDPAAPGSPFDAPMDWLAVDIERSTSTVKRHLQTLIRVGLLVRERRPETFRLTEEAQQLLGLK
jgi:DNA-binding MarR family transcriptional regulator